jgi:hypothetical protein
MYYTQYIPKPLPLAQAVFLGVSVFVFGIFTSIIVDICMLYLASQVKDEPVLTQGIVVGALVCLELFIFFGLATSFMQNHSAFRFALFAFPLFFLNNVIQKIYMLIAKKYGDFELPEIIQPPS